MKTYASTKSASGAPTDATYITQTANSGLSAEQALSLLATGIMKVTTTTGVISSVTAPTGALVGDTDTQTLTNKTITSATLNGTYSGWIEAGETWTYGSASTFTVATDLTTKYYKGVKIRWKDGAGYKYGHVASSSFASSTTTVTIVVNTDYTIANATLTSPAYSFENDPAAFPKLFNYSPTWVGFSANPTGTFAYQINGNLCYVSHYLAGYGTSNATGFTVTMPIVGNGASSQSGNAGVGRNNGTNLDTPIPFDLPSGSAVLTLFKTNSTGAAAWTNANGKGAYLSFVYEL